MADDTLTLEGLRNAIKRWEETGDELVLEPIRWTLHPKQYERYQAAIKQGRTHLEAIEYALGLYP